MTDKQMELIRKQLPALTRVPWNEWTEEQKQLDMELSCISMINSILAYGGGGFDAETVMRREENGYHNYLDKYVKMFGRERVVELIQGQIESIVGIRDCVYEDSDGCTYNSIIWVDEQQGGI